MKGDFTRNNDQRFKAYSSVRMQQGRVQLDSDWNEQAEIELSREEAELIDGFGQGVPMRDLPDNKQGGSEFGAYVHFAYPGKIFIGYTGYQVGGKFVSRAYVDGMLVEQEYQSIDVTIDAVPAYVNFWTIRVPSLLLPDGRLLGVGTVIAIDRPDMALAPPGPPVKYPSMSMIGLISTVTGNTLTVQMHGFASSVAWPAVSARIFATYSYDTQPFLPSPPPTPSFSTTAKYLAYLDVWKRHVTAVEDPQLRESALGGPDTTTRTQTVWQMKLLQITDTAKIDNGTWIDEVAPYVAPGTLKARYAPSPGQAQALENRLYRVEIHTGTASGTVTFKWSRDNGSQAAPWTAITGNKLDVTTQGRGEALGFANGQWIELSSDSFDLKNKPGAFVQISADPESTNSGQRLTVTVPAGVDTTYANYPGHPKVRRWDSNGAGYPTTVVAGWIPLENGIEVQFDPAANYQTGDHWLIPARPSASGIDWPQDASLVPLTQPAKRIRHGYLPLTLLEFSSYDPIYTDKRPVFYSLSRLNSRLDKLSKKVAGAISVVPAPMMVTGSSAPLTARPAWSLVLSAPTAGVFLGPYACVVGSDAYGVIPLQLPHRATLTSLTVRWATNASATIDLFLVSNSTTNGGLTNIPTASVTTGTTSLSQVNSTQPLSLTVNNESYTHFLRVSATSGITYIYSICIKYELEQVVFT